MGAISNIRRIRQITAVVARHGMGHYLEQRRSKNRTEPPPELRGVEEIPRSARRFRAILEELGPTFIKFGQILSTRPDLLPAGFAEALRGLQDDCPALDAAAARGAVEAGLGKPIDELFAEFDDQPVASASIAQVHRAVTKEGHEVAVKVQRPGIRDSLVDDLDLLRVLAEIVEAVVKESGLVTPRAIVDEFEDAFLGELDFTREARMLRRFAENARGKDRAYVVPEIYDELSGKTVLTMQFIRGESLLRLGDDRDKKQIALNLVNTAFEQLFADGLFHADPHPGNCFVLEDDRVALIDFGSVGQVSYAMRETLLVMVVACGLRDADTVARLLYRVGIPDERVSIHSLRDACASLFDEYLGGVELHEIEASKLLTELFDLAARFRIRMPSEYALIARASMTSEGIIRELDPNLDLMELSKPYVRRLIDEQFKIPEIGDSSMTGLLRARSIMSDLPLSASQILMDLESGKLRIMVEGPKLDSIARNIDALGVTVFMGLLAGGLVGGALIALGQYDLTLYGLPVIPVAALWAAGLLFASSFGWYFLSPRLKKMSLGRWLFRRRR